MQKLTDTELLSMIHETSEFLKSEKGLPPIDSIVRQLDWGRRKLLGEWVEPKPGPFTMGIIAVRELDGIPDIAEQVCLIQSELQAREVGPVLSDTEKRRRKRAYKEGHR